MLAAHKRARLAVPAQQTQRNVRAGYQAYELTDQCVHAMWARHQVAAVSPSMCQNCGPKTVHCEFGAEKTRDKYSILSDAASTDPQQSFSHDHGLDVYSTHIHQNPKLPPYCQSQGWQLVKQHQPQSTRAKSWWQQQKHSIVFSPHPCVEHRHMSPF